MSAIIGEKSLVILLSMGVHIGLTLGPFNKKKFVEILLITVIVIRLEIIYTKLLKIGAIQNTWMYRNISNNT